MVDFSSPHFRRKALKESMAWYYSTTIQTHYMVTTPLTLNLDTVHLTDELYQLCQNNQELKFEQTPKGELIIIPPVGGESGNREADLIADLVI